MLGREPERAAKNLGLFESRPRRRIRRVEGEIIADIEIEIPISIGIGKGAACTPAPIGDTGFPGDILEALTRLIAQQDIGSVAGDEEIVMAIPIVVSGDREVLTKLLGVRLNEVAALLITAGVCYLLFRTAKIISTD